MTGSDADNLLFEPQSADVESEQLAKVYAEALLAAAAKHGQTEEVFEELRSLVDETFRMNPMLRRFFASPAIPRRRKHEYLERAFTGKASPLLMNFLLVLNDRGRLNLLRPVFVCLRDILDDRANRVRIRVTTATPLSDEQLASLKAELGGVLKREPVLVPRVDPEILGGLVLQHRDTVYDHSVRARLNAITRNLLARSSHEISTRRNRFSTD